MESSRPGFLCAPSFQARYWFGLDLRHLGKGFPKARMGNEHLSSTLVMPKAPEGIPGQQGWEMCLPRLPFTALTGAPRCGLWFSQAQLEIATEILKCNVSLQPPPCAWLHTHSLEGPQPQPQNCHDSILFVRPANPPIHKKGSQLNLGFWVTFLAW